MKGPLIKSFLAALSATVLLVITSCGGGGGGGGTDEPAPDFFRATDVVVKPEVVVLPNAITLSERTETSIKLTGNLPALQAGSVVVSGQGEGLMRKVVSVTETDDGAVIQTEDAALTDVFSSAKIAFQRTLSPDDVAESQILIDGAEFGTASKGRDATATFPLSVPKTFVGVQTAPDQKYGVEMQASGELRIALTGNIVITPTNGLEQMAMGFATKWAGTHKAALVGELELDRREVPYAVEIFNPIYLGQAGPIPLVLLPVLSVQLAAKGTLKGGYEESGTLVANLSGGMAYVQNGELGIEDFAATTSASASGTVNSHNFFWDVKFEVVPVQLELTTSLDGLVGPTFKIDPPAGVIDIKRNLTTKEVDLTVEAAFRAKVGAKAGLLGLSLPLFEVTAVEKKYPIFDHTFKPGSGDVGVE